MKDFHGIALDMQVYNRWDDGDPSKSYQFLVDSVAKYPRRTLMEKNKAALHRGIGPMLQLPWQNYNNADMKFDVNANNILTILLTAK